MSNSTDILGTFHDDEGHWHPIAMATIRCFKAPDGSPGTEIVDMIEMIKPGRHCGLMMGHSGACDTECYDTEWDAEAIT